MRWLSSSNNSLVAIETSTEKHQGSHNEDQHLWEEISFAEPWHHHFWSCVSAIRHPFMFRRTLFQMTKRRGYFLLCQLPSTNDSLTVKPRGVHLTFPPFIWIVQALYSLMLTSLNSMIHHWFHTQTVSLQRIHFSQMIKIEIANRVSNLNFRIFSIHFYILCFSLRRFINSNPLKIWICTNFVIFLGIK